MKLKIFSFKKSNIATKINYNKPLPNSIKISNNNLQVKTQITAGDKLVKITDLIIKRLEIIKKRNEVLSAQLKNIYKF